MFEWSFAGINTSIPGTGGEECVNYLPAGQRLFETLTVTGIFAYLILWALARLNFPSFPTSPGDPNPVKTALLILHCVVFGIELGFKCATESLLWVLNPCHILTILQITMLACPPNILATVLFRLQMHMLNGPLLALAFPVLNTRQLPFEWAVYFIQHLLLLLIPVILLDQTSVYSVEPLDDLSWSVLALSLQILYHFLILQPIALLTGINLNHMLCPAVTDPFTGPHYRIMAMIHQPFLILILGKCISCFSLTWSSSPWPWQTSLITMYPSSSIERSATDSSNSASSNVVQSPGKLVWLKPEPESEMITLAATPWCWSDLFRHQTYFFYRQPSTTTTAYSVANEVPKHDSNPELVSGDEVRHRTSYK